MTTEQPDNYRPDVHGLVEVSWRTKPPGPHILSQACESECPDCCVNVFVEEDEEVDGQYKILVAHDDTCPWMTEYEKTHE
jgi:hypothetical protein